MAYRDGGWKRLLMGRSDSHAVSMRVYRWRCHVVLQCLLLEMIDQMEVGYFLYGSRRLFVFLN